MPRRTMRGFFQSVLQTLDHIVLRLPLVAVFFALSVNHYSHLSDCIMSIAVLHHPHHPQYHMSLSFYTSNASCTHHIQSLAASLSFCCSLQLHATTKRRDTEITPSQLVTTPPRSLCRPSSLIHIAAPSRITPTSYPNYWYGVEDLFFQAALPRRHPTRSGPPLHPISPLVQRDTALLDNSTLTIHDCEERQQVRYSRSAFSRQHLSGLATLAHSLTLHSSLNN